MWRAFFLAIGVSLCIFGAECMIIERAVLAASSQKSEPSQMFTNASQSLTQSRVVRPPEWAPWSFLSAGAVIILYSFTIPRRVNT